MSIIYSSGVYVLGTSKKSAALKQYSGYENKMLPKKINIDKLVSILVKMQQKCFEQNDIAGNTVRLIDLLTPPGREKTVAVVLSLGYPEGATTLMDFVDGGSATIQMSNQGFFKIQQPWINEVCRAKLIDNHTGLLKPIGTVFGLIDTHVLSHLSSGRKGINGVYLYIERKPEHGKASVLLDYYSKNYGFVELPERADDEFYYMSKKYLVESPAKKKSASTMKTTSVSTVKTTSVSPMKKMSARSTRTKSASPTKTKSARSTRRKSAMV